MNKKSNKVDLSVFGTETKNSKSNLNIESIESTPVPGPPKTQDPDMRHRIASSWGCVDDKYFAVPPTKSQLEPGLYSVDKDNYGQAIFIKKKIVTDDLILFEGSEIDATIKEIDSFWSKKESFKKYGFLHRRGYLFYGPAGSGKTALVNLIMKGLINQGGIVIQCEQPFIFNEGLKAFRKIEPHRPVICIYEDLDAIIGRYGESEILSILDGENQIDQVANIATTNYPERLDPRIVARPRRFDRITLIGMPSDNIRREYFKKKFDINDEELEKWVNATEGFSFGACAELVIAVKCLGNDFDSSVEILKSIMDGKKSSDDYYRDQMGFKNGNGTVGFCGSSGTSG